MFRSLNPSGVVKTMIVRHWVGPRVLWEPRAATAVSGSLGPPDSRFHRLKYDWCGYFLWSRWLRPSKLTHDFHHNPNPQVSEPFSPAPHRHVARGSKVPRNTGQSGPLSSAASHERRVLWLRSVGKVGPDPARVKWSRRWPWEGNVSPVESAALEWECSAIDAVASGFL